MAVYKEPKTNTWRAVYRYKDWTGETRQTQKRGFATRRDALTWEREQMLYEQADLDMTFASFVDTYTVDMKNRIKENTWQTKEHIIRTKILPYFSKRKIKDIQPKDIIAWQNEMIKGNDKNGKKYSPVYLKTLHNQLSAIFNHAVKFYGLKENPAAKVGNMGKARSREMLFWTEEEYQKFAFAMPDFLVADKQDYQPSLYNLGETARFFPSTKNYLHREMTRGADAAGVKRIRIHDLRHSHISLLIEMGYSAVAIADRVGHESINITYNYAHLFPSTQTDMADKLNNFRKEQTQNVS